MNRGGTTFSIGQLLDAADRDARMQRQQAQVKTAQAVDPATLDLLDTASILALARAGKKLASRMKTAEDDMEGSSGVNTGGSGMKDSLTPAAETPRQFIVSPSGKVDVSPSDNRFSIPDTTEQKAPSESLNPGASMPAQFLAPKIGQAQPPETVMSFEGGGPVSGSPVSLAPRHIPSPEARATGTIGGRKAVERTTTQQGGSEKDGSLDPLRAVHERYSRAAAALAKQAQPGGVAQPTTETGPLVGPAKPEATQPSGDTTGGDKPPSSFEGVRETSRQDADAKALADAGRLTDLPVAAAKETTEGVLDEVLKAASFRQFYSGLDQNSKLASLLRNRLARKTAQGEMQSGTTLPPMQIQGRLPGMVSFEGGGGMPGSPVGLAPRFIPEGPPLRTAIQEGQEAVTRGVDQPAGGPSLLLPGMDQPAGVPIPSPPGGAKPLPGMTDEMNRPGNPLSPAGQGL